MPIPFQHLRAIALLQSLPQEMLMRMSTQMSLRQFARREVVCSKEHSHFELGFLLEGRLQGVDFTVDGRGVGLYFVDAGDYFGELPIIDGLRPSEHVVAVARSTAVFLDLATAQRLILEHSEIAQSVMTRMARRVRTMSAQRTLLALPNPFQRLCVQLLLLADRNTSRLDPVPTHLELAMMINASRETVTRAFQSLMLNEAIRRDGSRLLLLRHDYLEDIGAGRVEPPRT